MLNATTPHPATGRTVYSTPLPPNLMTMKRGDLEALAAERGIANPGAYRNTTLLVKAIERGPDPADDTGDTGDTDDEPETPAEAATEDAPPSDESE
jgi:hypothetical protein